MQLGDGDEKIVGVDRNAAEDFLVLEIGEHLFRRKRRAHDELVVHRRAIRQMDRRNLAQLLAQIRGLLQTLRRHFAQPFFAEQRQIHVRRKCEKRLIRADVRRRFATADVLFACGQREHVGAAAVDVDRFTDQTSRHMSLQRIAHDHESDIRSAERCRDAPRLPFADADVESMFSRRRENPERSRCGGRRRRSNRHGAR